MRKVIPILALLIFTVAMSLAQLANSAWPMRGHDLQHTGRSPYNGPATAVQKWTFMTRDYFYSCPALGADGTVYIGSTDRKLYAVNPDGTQRWAFTTGGGIESSPALGADGTVYVGSIDRKLYAVNPDGTQRWVFTTGSYISSSPAIGSDGTVYFGSYDNKLYAVNPDGTQRWVFTTGDYIYSSPALGADGTVYVGSKDNKLYAVNPDGTQRWAFTTGGEIDYSSPALGADGTVYIGSYDNKLYAINPDGTQRWAITTGGKIESSPAIGADGTVYVGSFDKKLYAIKPDGTQRWVFMTGALIYSSPALGADGTVYIGSNDHKLYAIKPDGTQRWTFTTGSKIESSPAIGADGTVYIGSGDGELYAIGSGTAQTITITPSTATLNIGATQQFTATPAVGVTWTATGGTISNTGLFTAGNTAGTYTITAKNLTDTATANVTITAAQTLSITPPTATLNTGATQQFTANPAAGVTWTATGGTISNTGLFTAGNTAGTYSVTAKNLTDTATASVTITAPTPTITITAPNGGEQWQQGVPENIFWTSANVPGNLNIDLYKAGVFLRTISANIPNTGNGASVTLAAAIAPAGTDYRLKISSVTDPTVNSMSAADFEITAAAVLPTITITAPNGGEQWQQGSVNQIEWTFTGNPGNVKIELFKGGVLNRVIVDTLANSGRVNWVIPAAQATGTDYKVKISSITDPAVTTMSAADFEINGTPILTITPPTATLNTGVTQQFTATPATGVTWAATGGTISNSGLYTAGNTAGTYVVTAKSAAGTATANVTINPTLTLTITPPTAILITGATQQFTANPSTGVAWLATGGTISNTGLYTAGNSAGTFTVVAKTALSTASATVTITAKPTLATPVLLSPANRAVNIAMPTTIAWQPVNNAVSYEYELFGAASATVPIETNTVTTTSATIQYNLTAKTIYTWRVRAIDANDLQSAFSIKWAFTTLAQAVIGTPVLILPQNNAIDVVINPTLTWRSAANAAVYSVEIATDAAFTNNVVNVQDVTTTSYDVTNLTNKTKYYWRIKGGNGTIWGSPATASFITIAKQGLAVPVLTSPTNGSTGAAIATTLTWQPVANAVSYTVQYATNNNFSNATVLTGAVTTQNVTLLANTRYYWRVNATDIDGNASAWSSAWYFTTLTQAIQIDAPTLITPADGDIDIPVKTTFTWSSVANVIAYDLEISKDATFTTKAAMGSTTTSLTATLANNIVYYWRVRGKNGNNLGIWSTTGTFTTVAFVPTAGVDAAIANSKVGNPLFGIGVVNNDGTLQTVNVDQPINRQSEFNIVVKNTGNLPDNFLITTASTINAKWKVTVYDISGVDISKKVFNGGWSSYTVKPGESVILRLRFAAASGQTIDPANPPTQTIMLTAQSWKDITNGVATPASDTVVATAVLVKMSK
jgi:outer membrane protein assembly factor BamB